MGLQIRTVIATALVTVLGAALLLLAGGRADADTSDPPVVQGTWTIHLEVKDHLSDFGTVTGDFTYRFGAGCTVGQACAITTQGEKGDPADAQLEADGDGFTVTNEDPLSCFDPTTGATTTEHGADYTSVERLRVTDTAVRDGVTYATALSGTLVETITINAAGRAEDCEVNGPDPVSETQHSVLTGTALELPPVGDLEPPEAIGVTPADAEAAGTLGEFLLPRSRTADESVEAVNDGRRSSVPGALVTPGDSADSLADRLPQDLLLVAAMGLLIVFPAQIVNSTYEENHERVEAAFRRFRRLRRDPGGAGAAAQPGRGRRLGVFLACAVVGTVLGGLLDPGFGADRPTYALLAGVFLALLVAVLVAAAAAWLFRSATHKPHAWVLRAIPSALMIAVLCVVVSRLTHFSPGYLYGLIGGAVFAGSLERRSEGRAEAAVLLATLLVALGAWFGFAQVVSRANEPGASFAVLVADALLGCLFIGGIEGLLFSLIPLRFLPGHRLRLWGWVPWALLTLVTTYLFVHVLLAPESGYLGRSTSVSVTLTLALFGAFGAASVAFWAWFRFRPSPGPPPEPTEPVEPTEPTEETLPMVVAP